MRAQFGRFSISSLAMRHLVSSIQAPYFIHNIAWPSPISVRALLECIDTRSLVSRVTINEYAFQSAILVAVHTFASHSLALILDEEYDGKGKKHHLKRVDFLLHFASENEENVPHVLEILYDKFMKPTNLRNHVRRALDYARVLGAKSTTVIYFLGTKPTDRQKLVHITHNKLQVYYCWQADESFSSLVLAYYDAARDGHNAAGK